MKANRQIHEKESSSTSTLNQSEFAPAWPDHVRESVIGREDSTPTTLIQLRHCWTQTMQEWEAKDCVGKISILVSVNSDRLTGEVLQSVPKTQQVQFLGCVAIALTVSRYRMDYGPREPYAKFLIIGSSDYHGAITDESLLSLLALGLYGGPGGETKEALLRHMVLENPDQTAAFQWAELLFIVEQFLHLHAAIDLEDRESTRVSRAFADCQVPALLTFISKESAGDDEPVVSNG